MIGTKLAGRYELLRELGRGGMGVVYLAKDPMLDREVAIKVLAPNFLNPEMEERFKREARTVARLDHNAIVGVHDIGAHDSSLFFVMPFVEGSNLRDYLKNRSLSLPEYLQIGIQIAEALDYSHSQGVIHRDIKPENIMISHEEVMRVRITDFGLAVRASERRISDAGLIAGTVLYLSPEQVEGHVADARTDIYSLGTILYECVVGETPFSGDIQSVLYRVVHEYPSAPADLGIQIHPELENLIMSCLQKSPELRPSRAREIVETLTRIHFDLLNVQQSSDRMITTIQYHYPTASAFIGREKEMSEIQRRFTAALNGECQFLLIGGESGIGKSRIILELMNLAQVRKMRILHGCFYEEEAGLPYQAFREIFQEYFRSMAKIPEGPSGFPDLSDLTPDLISIFPELAEMESLSGVVKAPKNITDRTYVFDLLAVSMLRMSNLEPILIVLEDLHNTDLSNEAVEYIARRLAPYPVLILGTYRTTDVNRNHAVTRLIEKFQGDRRFSHMILQPFTFAEQARFVEAMTRSSFDDEILKRLFEATEGNPFFIQELVRSLIDSGAIVKDEDGQYQITSEMNLSAGIFPETIQQTVERRIRRLSDELRRVLSAASILGKSFEMRDLRYLLDFEIDLEDAVDRLIADSFLEEDRESGRSGRIRFTSGVVCDVLYSDLPRRKRKTFHLLYAEELERRHANVLDRVYPQLLHHYSRADEAEKVVKYGLQLGRKSLQTFSAEDAIRSLKTVLDFGEGLQEGEAREMLGHAYRMAGKMEEAVQEYEEATKIFVGAGERQKAVRVILGAAEASWEFRKVDDALLWIEKGIEASKLVEDRVSLMKFLTLATTLYNLRAEPEKARQYWHQREMLETPVNPADSSIIEGGTVVVAVPRIVQTIDPVLITIDEERDIASNVFETLLTTDAQGNLIPGLCDRWEILNDGKSFLFELSDGICFSNGEPVTSNHVRESFERGIRKAARFPAFRAIQEIEILSDDSFRIDLKEPLPIYPILLTDVITGIVMEAEDQIIGTGPFSIQEFKSSNVKLRKNLVHWRNPQPHIDAIQFLTGTRSSQAAAGFRSGQFDIVQDLQPGDLETLLRDRHQQVSLIEAPKRNTCFALFNQNSLLCQMAPLRVALFGTVRTHDLVRQTLGRFARPAVGLLPPGMAGYDPARRRQLIDPEQIQNLLQMAGLNSPIRLHAVISPALQDHYATLFAALLKAWGVLGIHISLETPTQEIYREKVLQNQGIDLLFTRWNADYNDPDDFTYNLFHSSGGAYRKFYSSKETDEWLDEARKETAPAFREKIYRKFENHIISSGFLLPLFHDIDYRLTSPKVRAIALRGKRPYVNYESLMKREHPTTPSIKREGGGTLHVPISGEMWDLDPSLSNLEQGWEVIPPIFETLTRHTEGAGITPWLAAEFEVKDEARSFYFRLRENVRFHDGKRLTSRDVRYSFERLLLNQRSEKQWLLQPIRGAREFTTGQKSGLQGFQIVNDLEFIIHLDQSLPFFPALLADVPASILPEGLSHCKGSWTDGCVGTGPFRILRFDPGHRLELEANPHYWREGFPKANALSFTFGLQPDQIMEGFRDGQFSVATDLFPEDVERLRRDSDKQFSYKEWPRLSTYFMILNIHHDDLKEPGLRQKILDAVSVEDLVHRLLGRLAIPANGLIPPGMLGHEAVRPRRKKITTGSKINVELTGMIHSIYTGRYAEFATELLKAFHNRGIHLRVADTKSESLHPRPAWRAFDFARWIPDYPDTDNFIHAFHSQKGTYSSFCRIPELDELFDRGRNAIIKQERNDIYRMIERVLSERSVILPLFHEQAYRFAGKEVEGFAITFTPPFVPYEKMWVKS